MPFGGKVNGGSNYKCSNFEDQERRLGNVTMDIVFEPAGQVQNENRKILLISLGKDFQDLAFHISLNFGFFFSLIPWFLGGK